MSSDDFRIDRRKFLGAAAGAAGAAALGTWAPGALSRPGGPNSPLVTSASLGIQHFSVRDATDRPASTSATPVMGYLGGPTFPENPADLGPLVPLPGGFQEVFEYLSSVGDRRASSSSTSTRRSSRWATPAARPTSSRSARGSTTRA